MADRVLPVVDFKSNVDMQDESMVLTLWNVREIHCREREVRTDKQGCFHVLWLNNIFQNQTVIIKSKI